MKKKYDGKEVLNEVMTKMFSYVEATYTEGICKEPEWYLKHEWAEEQEKDFRDWLVNEYKTNPEKYSSLYNSLFKKGSDRIETSVGWFIMNYGWKTKKK